MELTEFQSQLALANIVCGEGSERTGEEEKEA